MYLKDEAAAAHPVVTIAGRDYHAWAKQIIYRDRKGDKTLLPIQIQFAKEALGIVEPSKQ